jgi:chromosome segregation ATPase
MIRTQQRDSNPLFNDQQRRQVERVRNDLLQAQNQNNYFRKKNREMEKSIADLKQKINDLNDRGESIEKEKRLKFILFYLDILGKVKAERDIDELRRRLERVEHTYNDVTAFKTSLEKEIATYRELLESKYLNVIFHYFSICFL